MKIRPWVESTFASPGSKTFIEIGAHVGQDTVWLAAIPGVTVHALEPDPRNYVPEIANVVSHRLAIADRCGLVRFHLSHSKQGRPYTKSSSIHQPTNHLTICPEVIFGETIEVEGTTLDAFAAAWVAGPIDLIWADVQGAERELIEGGQAALARTSYLYTEYSDEELYEGQLRLIEILALLPGWRVLYRWPYDVLLRNHGGA